MQKSSLILKAAIFSFASAALVSCAAKIDDSSSNRKAMAAYCPYVSSPRAHSSPMTVTGTAKYEYRLDGAGLIPNGSNALAPIAPANGAATTYSFNLGATPVSYTCASNCTHTDAVKGLTLAINGLAGTTGIRAYGISGITPYRIASTAAVTISNLSASMKFLDAKPIRYAEVRATAASGEIVQCAETDANGAFTMSLPSDGAAYTVSILSRSANSSNTAYVLSTPSENTPYALSQTVQTTSGTALTFRALATGSLEGGAFNILDQIATAQAYLRTTTAGCNNSANANFFNGCIPVTTVPIVYAYWSAGLTPGVYYGISGPISFYLNGDKELYILGGVNGDTSTSDMDHFDNSVIIHEYGHFIEDQFGAPNSPGGSHNGNAIIDPRLAWGEGWANFFQAAVTGIPYYRDTTGYLKAGCGVSCNTTNAFNEGLNTEGGISKDQSTDLGEGNFREFSISRVLFNITTVVSRFSEIWTVFNGSSGMRVVADGFKSINRFHVIHSGVTNASSSTVSWASAQASEYQKPNFADYATKLSTSISCSATPMAINVTGSDNGSFSKSDLFRNNDFYAYAHPGGQLTVSVDWSGSDLADLDLYIYKPDYTYGDTSSSSLAGMDNLESSTTGGNASVSRNLPAGTYMINVMAYTGVYSINTVYNTSYTLRVNGALACPQSL